MIENNGIFKTSCEHLDEQLPKFSKQLQMLGEAGTIKNGNDGILVQCIAPCMFVAYSCDHDGNHYSMHKTKTKWVLETRDVILFKCMYYQKQNAP